MASTKRLRGLAATAAAATLLVAAPASADILIEFDDLISAPVGTVRTVAEADVPSELVGDTCRISVIAENQASVHPGNDLIVSTGDGQAVFVGVEDEANGGTTETFEVVVGPTIIVQMRFGPDELSSLGFDLSFDCTPNPGGGLATATSTTPTSASPTSQPTTAAPTTEPPTTEAPSTSTPVPPSAPPTSAAQEVTTTTAPAPTTPPPTTTPPPAPAQQDGAGDLPTSPAASAIVAAPAYAG